jgi:SET domain-containing protein
MRQSIIQNLKLPQCKLGVSQISNAGVGVFALTDFPKGYLVFAPKGLIYSVFWNEVPNLQPSVKKYIKSICHSSDECFYIDRVLDQVDLSFYVNHSDSPNLIHDEDSDTYISKREIKEGEELTVFYPLEERDWIN